MDKGLSRDYLIVAVIALVSCLMLAWVANLVGLIAVAGGQGWDGSVFVRVIREIAQDTYSNSDPYRAARSVAFPAIFLVESYRLPVDIVLVQRDVNIALMVLSACMLYGAARLMDVSRKVAVTSVATFFGAWCVLVVPVFTPILTDHLAMFTSSVSLFLWAADRKRGLYPIIAACIWIMPPSALVPLALLALGRNVEGDSPARASVCLDSAFLLAALMVCAAVYVWKGPGVLTGVDTHVLDVDRNTGGQLTGSVALLPVSILILIGTLFVCIRTGVLFLTRHVHDFNIWRIAAGLAFVVASYASMRGLIDFDKGFSASQLINNMSKQALSAPFKSWVAHTAYFGPVVLVVYYHVALRRTSLPPALSLCLIGFMPLLALGSESRQWIAILPVVALAVAFLPLSLLSRLVLLVMSWLTFWGIWGLNADVNLAVSTNVGLQHPLWDNYMGRVGPWMSMDVYGQWLAWVILMVVALVLAHLQSADHRADSRPTECRGPL